MKRILFTVIGLLIIISSFGVVSVFAATANTSPKTKIDTKVDTKINTNMYYFDAKKTVVNDKGIAVSISISGSIATCANLSIGDWKIITNTKSIELKDILVVNNKFMAIATINSDSILLTSTDGIKWTEKIIKDYSIENMFYVNGSYFTIAVDSQRQYAIFKTVDFVTFNKVEAENDIGVNIYPKADKVNLYISDITYFKGRYYLCGMYNEGNPRSFMPDYCKGIVISSKDLKTWKVCIEAPTMLRHMVQSGNTLMAYGGDSYLARLNDENSISSMMGKGIPLTNMFYSNDGETFKECNINFETNAGAFDKIAYTGDKFFGISYKKIGISSDGITWTTQSDDINWMYGGYYNGKYVAVGTDIHNNSRKVLAISNVNSGWDVTECITNFPTKRMSSISSFAMESGGNYILSENSTGISLDLLNWKSNLGYEFDSYRSILFDGKRFVAVTNDSVISSINGVAWETNYKLLDRIDQTDDIYKYFNDIYFSNGKYYIYGVKWGDGWENYVWISDDLTNWKDYKLRINDYVENRNSNLSGIQVSIIENRAVLVGNSFEAKQMIIATSDDMYNFTPIKTDSYKSSIGKVYYYDNKYFTFTTEALDEKVLSANPFYTITKASAFKDYIYISNDLKTFEKLELPSNHVKAIYPFKDSFVVVAREYPKFKVYLTKDFIKYESYEIPTEIPNLNLTGDEEGIYNVFSIDDVLYITGARVMYTKNFKDWTILNSLPSNGYISVATNDNYAVIGGHGIMVKIFQGNLIVTPNGK